MKRIFNETEGARAQARKEALDEARKREERRRAAGRTPGGRPSSTPGGRPSPLTRLRRGIFVNRNASRANRNGGPNVSV